jgi:hypothetical protein
MLLKLKRETETLPACFDDAHNQRIMAHRARLASATRALTWQTNDEWFARMWRTPDVGMCLGRYDD